MDFAENWYVQEAKKHIAVDYIADCMRFIVNNTAGQEERYTVSERLHDMLNPRTVDYTADEVITNIKQKLAELGA